MTLEDTPKEAKLHGLQCPLDASSCDSFSRFHATRPMTAVVGGRLGETPLPPRGKSIAPNRGCPGRSTNIIAKALAFGKGGILKLSDRSRRG